MLIVITKLFVIETFIVLYISYLLHYIFYLTLLLQIIGFLNFFLWASDLWFLYKETPWFQSRQNMGSPT